VSTPWDPPWVAFATFSRDLRQATEGPAKSPGFHSVHPSARSVYLVAVGGAAFLLSKSIRRARVVAFEDLGMEAIHEFEFTDFPVTVAVDARGASIHRFAALHPAPLEG